MAGRKLADELKTLVKKAVNENGANVAKAINVGGEGKTTSVSSKQKIVQRDGNTETVTERTEHKHS